MSSNESIHRIAIVGTGVIGASWAACGLARGFDVVATDPAPNAEAKLRAYVKEAWELLSANGLAAGASLDRLSFTSNLKDALAHADFVQENGPEKPDFKIKLFADMDEATPADSIIASSSSHHGRDPIRLQASRTVRDRASLQPAAHYSTGRGGRRGQNFRGNRTAGNGLLRVHREKGDPPV